MNLTLNILLLTSLFNQILSSEATINFPSEVEKSFVNENSPTYVDIIIDNYDEIKNQYLHISTQTDDKKIMPIIISSTSNPHPSINSSDSFSTQRIGDAKLFLGKELLDSKIYLNITCNFYPCSYNLVLNKEQYPLLQPGETFSYFVKDRKNNITTFKINSQTSGESSSYIINKSGSHILTIAASFSNQNIIDTELELKLKDKTELIKIDTNYNMPKRIIYAFNEENLIKEKGGDPDSSENYYLLRINSNDEQYITITVSSKEIFDENDEPITNVVPNEGGKYSLLKKNLLIRECYSVNTTMGDYSNSLIFASISFYTKPVNYYFSDNKREIITPILNSINIIFEKNETGEYQDLCFVLENENDEGIYKIEISETNDIFNKKNIYDPLNTGSIYIKSLPINQLTYFTHNPANRDYEQMNFNLKVIKGKVEMFLVRCETFPDCSYTYEELLEESKKIENDIIIKPHIINDMFSYSDYAKEGETDLAPFNYKQNLMFVYCSEETKIDLCKFEISYFTEKDKILLLNNDKFYQYMLTDEVDLYQINVPKSSDPFSKIQVILYTFTGDANYQTLNEKNDTKEINITHDFVGGKEIYEYTPKQTFPISEKVFNIQFQIKAVTNTYYEVEYKIIKIEYDETNLENKIFFDEKYTLISTDITYKDQVKYISGDEENNLKYFVFENNRKEEQNPYFVQIFSLNCEIIVKRDGKMVNESENIYQDIISTNDLYYENKYYVYETNLISFENYGDEETEHQCIIYISGEPLDKEQTNKNNIYSNKILLTENDPHDIILTNDIKSYRYLFPFLGYSESDDSFMLVHINFDSKMSIKAKFYFDESDMQKEETLGRSGQILLNNKLLKENCKDIEEICNLIIEINFYNVDKYDNRTWSSPNFQLFISSHNKIPSYLKNGELRLDSVVHSNPRQYFYTDIPKNSQGQVILNTKRGEGVLYVRIYKKGAVDNKRSWGDIEIPGRSSSDLLNYDHFTHSVHFEKDHTSKCAYAGCLLLITYQNTFSPSKNPDYLIPFTLLTRLYNKDKTKQSILDIPLKAYAYGAIEKRLLPFNYFRIYFPEDAEKIDFEIQCETCILYINKNENLPTPENHDLEYYSHGKFGVFGYLIEKGESIKKKFYTLRIESHIISSRYVTTYSLRVLLPTPSSMINYNLIPVDSDQNANCDLSLYSNDGICYFIVYLDDNSNELGDILAHVYTDVDLIDLEINANFIPKEIAERAELNDMLNYLPEGPQFSSFSTENEFYSDYLLIDIKERKNDDYIIFGVKSVYSATVTFLSTFYDYKDRVISNSNTVQLMKMNSNSKIELTLGYNNFYLIYLYSLYGTGEITWVDEYDEIKTHKFTEHELFSFTYYIRDNYTYINSYDNNLAFYIWQDVRQPELFTMNEMDFNMRERFIYTHSSIFLKYFCLLPLIQNPKNNEMEFEDLIYYIELNSPNEIGINATNELLVEGTIVTMEMINKIKLAKDDKAIIDSEKNIKINYDLSTNSAFIILTKEYCQNIWNNLNNTDGSAYLYISIRQKVVQEIDKEISGQMFVTFRNNTDYIVLSNQVINTKIDIIEDKLNYYLYNLELDGSYEKNKIVLDISPNAVINENNLLYSLIDYKDYKKINNEIIKKNSSNIEIDGKNSKYNGGKYHVEFTLKEKNVKGIYLCLFINKTKIKENELKSINVMFKYLTYKPSDELAKYEFNNEIEIKQEKENLIINLNKIKKIENSNAYYPNCQFVVRKIEYDDKILNEEFSTITLIETSHEIIYSYKDDKNDKDKIELTIPYEKVVGEKFYISIIANLYEENEKFAYITLEHQSKDDEKEEEEEKHEEEKEEEHKEEEHKEEEKEEEHKEEEHKEEEKEEEHKEEEKEEEEKEEEHKEEEKKEEEKKEEEEKEEDDKDDSTSMIILIVIMGIIVVVIIILIYLYIYKRNMNKDTEKLMQISFNEGKGGQLYDKEEKEEIN